MGASVLDSKGRRGGIDMKLSEIEYRRCKCGIKFPLASLKSQKNTASKEVLPDEYVAHENKMCRPCMHLAEKAPT